MQPSAQFFIKCLGGLASRRRAVAITLSLMGNVAIMGCEKMQTATRQADRKVEDNWHRSRQELVNLDENATKNLQSAIKIAESPNALPADKEKAARTITEIMSTRQHASQSSIKDAANDAKQQGVSKLAKAQASAMLAEQDLAEGRQKVVELRTIQQQVDKKIWELRQLATRLSTIAADVSQARRNEPTTGRTEIDKQKTEAQAAIAGLDQKIAELKADAGKRQQAMDAQIAKQAEFSAQSDQLADQSSTMQGQASVDVFNKSVELRKQASQIAAQMAVEKAKLDPVTQQIAALQAQKKISEAAVIALDEQRKVLDESWQKLNGLITAQQQQAQKLLDDEAKTRADELAKLLEDENKERSAVDAVLKQAATHFGDAAVDAEQSFKEIAAFTNEHTSKSDQDAFTALQNSINTGTYRLDQAEAQHTLAVMQYDHLAMLKNQQAMQEAVASAARQIGATIPPALAVDISKEISDAQGRGEEASSQADANLVKATSGNTPAADQSTAKILHIYEAYARYAATGSGDDLKTAEKFRNVFLAGGNSAAMLLPPLPRELGGEVKTVAMSNSEQGGDTDQAKKVLLAFGDNLSRRAVDAAEAQTQLPEEQKALLPDFAQFAGARQDLKVAVEQRFPADKSAVAAAVPSMTDEFRSSSAKATDDAVSIDPGDGNPPIVLKKIEGVWKIVDLGIAPGRDIKVILQSSTKAYADLREEVAADKYPKLEDVKTALQDRLKQMANQ